MRFEEYKKLSESERIEYLCQVHIDPELFQKIQNEFLIQYCSGDSVSDVVVGGYGIGEVPAIVVTINKNCRVSLPQSFMGLPVIKRKKRQ